MAWDINDQRVLRDIGEHLQRIEDALQEIVKQLKTKSPDPSIEADKKEVR